MRGGMMMWWWLGVVLVGMGAPHTDQPSVVFRGLDMELTRTTDAMSDARGCTLSIGPPAWQVVLTAHDDFFIRRATGVFAPDEQHLIRVGTHRSVRVCQWRVDQP